MNIYSRINPTEILHIINRKRDIQEGRKDLVEPENFLQVATINVSQGTEYKPHKHLYQEVTSPTRIAQECWVIITGLVQVVLYDTDNTVLHTDVLEPGDCSITLHGGHTYKHLQPSVVYEIKSGPYNGQENDKVFI